jgi:hypothetical protein
MLSGLKNYMVPLRHSHDLNLEISSLSICYYVIDIIQMKDCMLPMKIVKKETTYLLIKQEVYL